MFILLKVALCRFKIVGNCHEEGIGVLSSVALGGPFDNIISVEFERLLVTRECLTKICSWLHYGKCRMQHFYFRDQKSGYFLPLQHQF